MQHFNRILIMGHPGAGKALLGKSVAEKLGWTFINADFELEYKIGETIDEILGTKGALNFKHKYQEILSKLPEKSVVTTDASIASMDIDLENSFIVYLQASTSVQVSRVARNKMPLLLDTSLESFFDTLHKARDNRYELMADLVIDSDDNELELHIGKIIDHIGNDKLTEPVVLEQKDMIMLHNTLHTPVKLTKQQASCLKLLAHGKSSKEIAKALHISHRTVEGYINKIMATLGCSSSKELIKVYFYKP